MRTEASHLCFQKNHLHSDMAEKWHLGVWPWKAASFTVGKSVLFHLFIIWAHVRPSVLISPSMWCVAPSGYSETWHKSKNARLRILVPLAQKRSPWQGDWEGGISGSRRWGWPAELNIRDFLGQAGHSTWVSYLNILPPPSWQGIKYLN